MRWTPKRITDESVRLNRMVDGGWVTIVAHPIFGFGRWLVQIEVIGGKSVTIGSDPDIDRAIRQARRWIEDNRPAVSVPIVPAPYANTPTHANGGNWPESTLRGEGQ